MIHLPDNTEFQNLLDENAQLRSDNIRYKEEIIQLQETLGIRESLKDDFGVIRPSEIIQNSFGREERICMLSNGRDKEFQKNDIVISRKGLAGKILEANNRTSQMLLIIDRNSAVAGMIQTTRQQGVIYGTGKMDELLMELESPAREVQQGDAVISSGLGGIFPKGLYVGKVKEILKDEYGLYERIIVQPGVDFSTLEIVGVITDR